MCKKDEEKLFVFVSSSSSNQKISFIKNAVKKIAQQLNLEFEVVNLSKSVNQTFVCYRKSGADKIPLYYEKTKYETAQEIYTKIKNMLFVLSFHPNHGKLKEKQDEILVCI